MAERPRHYEDGGACAGAPLIRIGEAPLRPGAFERYLRFAQSQLLALAESDVQAIRRRQRARRSGR